MDIQSEIEKRRLYSYYLVHLALLANTISWYCKQTQNYIWDSMIYNKKWQTEVPKLEAHFLCDERNKLTFDDFWDGKHRGVRETIKNIYLCN